MEHIYLEEAYRQLEEVKHKINGIISLLERGLLIEKGWCDHCKKDINIDKKGRCPCCGSPINRE